ncbi:MAG: hypothetical protein IPN92_04735 [Chromatiaceae bacterium]|nr:hypothetical protein [Chromatiaceae bacterium]
MLERLALAPAAVAPTVVLDAGIATEANLTWLKNQGYPKNGGLGLKNTAQALSPASTRVYRVFLPPAPVGEALEGSAQSLSEVVQGQNKGAKGDPH